MLKRFFVLAILTISILWLVVSYLPGVQAVLPTVAFTGSSLLAVLAVIALILFVAVQLWLLYTTMATLRTYQAKDHHSPFRLRIGTEFFWTALPIVMTLGLAWASYALWLGRSAP